jgi:hypothetical protein
MGENRGGAERKRERERSCCEEELGRKKSVCRSVPRAARIYYGESRAGETRHSKVGVEEADSSTSGWRYATSLPPAGQLADRACLEIPRPD